MEELVRFIISRLVDKTDDISIEAIDNGSSTTLKVSVSPDDMGKVIGKKGKIAQAIRTLVKTIGNKGDRKYFIQIGEEGERV